MSESLADVVHEAVERAKADEDRKPMTLTEFLLARIAEEEEVCEEAKRAAISSSAYTDGGFTWLSRDGDLWDFVVGSGIDRALAECEAKRQIVALHDEAHDDGDPRSWEWPYVGCATLRAVALPYVEHPDFDPSWRL